MKSKTKYLKQAILIAIPFWVLAFCFFSVYQLNQMIASYVSTPRLGIVDEQSNNYAEQRINVNGDEYEYHYVFKDHKGNLTTWDWSMKKSFVDEMGEQFGIPVANFESTSTAPQDVVDRKMAIKSGLFYEDGDKIEPNYKAIADVHNIIAAPLYTLSEEGAQNMGGNRIDQVELLLKFCQDMPYKEPPQQLDGRVIMGVLPPALSLTKGYGDCDTKAMIFASALKNHSLFEMVVIYLPNHLMVGVRGVPRPYQTAIKYRGQSYIVADPSGKRLNFGEKPDNVGPIQMVRGI